MSFVYPHISAIAIVAAALSQFVLGFLWYSPITPIGQAWLDASGLRGNEGKPGPEMAVFPVSAIVAAWAVAMAIGWSGAQGVAHSVLAAWVVAAAVGGQSVASVVASTHPSVRLAVINVAYLAVGYALMGAIIALLK